ncbi:monocarboxylate transporter 5-like [Babylonia areolata]|uniref:monocarboxylate transporter 5-like n=1 Tax=Babylonia areolata TaxID=304850 RepID=UPI003FD056AC
MDEGTTRKCQTIPRIRVEDADVKTVSSAPEGLDAGHAEDLGHPRAPSSGAGPETESQQSQQHHHHHLHPVDTGWAWVILLAVFVIQLVSAGLLRALGIVFMAIQSTFGASASMIAVIGGVESAAFSVTAVFCMSGLLNVISVRRCTLIGGLVGTCGLVASFFVSSVTPLIFSFAVCLGVGMGLSMAPGYILLNTYFQNKLPLAAALANTGSSIGCIVMPMVTRMLLDQYFLSGTLLLLGGMFAQILVFGALLTPPQDYGRGKRGGSHPNPGLSEAEMGTTEWPPVRAKESSKESERRVRPVSECRVTEDRDTKEFGWSTMEPLTQSLPTIHQRQSHPRYHQLQEATMTTTTTTTWRDLLRKRLTMGDTFLNAASMSNVASLIAFNNTNVSAKDFGFLDSLVNIRGKGRLVASVQSEKDISSSSSNSSSNSRDTDGEWSSSSSESSDSSQRRWGWWRRRRSSSLFKTCAGGGGVCDSGLWRSPLFWVLAAYHFAGSLVCSIPSSYLPALAQEKGLTLTQGALLLTVSGSLDVVSRLVPGILAQSHLVRPQVSVAVSMLVLGGVFQLTGVVEGLAGLMALSVMYGLFSGVFFSMLQIIILDLSGRDRFRQVFSFTQLSLGASGVCGFLIVGYLRDLNGSYLSSFHFMGTCGLLAAVLLMLMPSVQRREASRQRELSSFVDVESQ